MINPDNCIIIIDTDPYFTAICIRKGNYCFLDIIRAFAFVVSRDTFCIHSNHVCNES